MQLEMLLMRSKGGGGHSPAQSPRCSHCLSTRHVLLLQETVLLLLLVRGELIGWW